MLFREKIVTGSENCIVYGNALSAQIQECLNIKAGG